METEIHRKVELISGSGSKRWVKLLFINLLLGWTRQSLGDTVHAAYGNYPIAPGRTLAMGGANTALSDDASAVMFNPAGVALTKTKFDFSTASNYIVNKEADIFTFNAGEEKRKDGFPYTAGFVGGIAKFGSFAFGAGQTTQYNLETKEENGFSNPFSLKVQSTDGLLAVAITDKLGLGITAHYEKASLSWADTFFSSTTYEDASAGIYYTYGAIYKLSDKITVGLAHTPQRLYKIDESLNTQASTLWFYPIGIAQKTSIGLHIHSSNRLYWVFDIDSIVPVKNATYVGSTLAFSVNNQLSQETATVIHGGYEFVVKKEKDFEFLWRGGGYKEPSRIIGEPDRLHFTMGVEMRLWIFALSAAYDQADQFSNTAQSVSLVYRAL